MGTISGSCCLFLASYVNLGRFGFRYFAANARVNARANTFQYINPELQIGTFMRWGFSWAQALAFQS